MQFRVLGPVTVHHQGSVVPIRPGKTQRLLAVLLSRAGRPVTVDQLVDALWGDAPPASARTNTKVNATVLRKSLAEEGRLVWTTGGYTLRVESGELDSLEFDEKMRFAKQAKKSGNLAHAKALLEEGLALWRGAPYADIHNCGPVDEEAVRLDNRRLEALEEHGEIGLALGCDAELLPRMWAGTVENPYRERLHAQLMHALYRSGRQTEALAVFDVLRTRLADELGIEPGRPLQELHNAILRGDQSLLRASTTESSPPAQLPADTAVFTGRGETLEDVLAIARQTEAAPGTVVVSALDGMAGVGKTALTVHVAHRLAEDFPDGQIFVDLHGFTKGVDPVAPSPALERLLRSIGVAGDEIPQDVDERAALWRTRAAGKRLIVVLDNAVDESQVRPLLPASPGCLVLVTSRKRLAGLVDATTISLDVLPLMEATSLFARIVGPQRMAAEPTRLIDEIVELCGRLPLAIRIVATRMRNRRFWTLAQLSARLRAARDLLPELDAGGDSVAAAFGMSFRHLEVEHRRFFGLLTLHPGADFDAHAAAWLAGIDLGEAERILETLTDAHLLESSAYGRYTFHDLLRLHALSILTNEVSESQRNAAVTRLFDGYLCAAARAMDLYAPADWPRRPKVPSADIPPLDDFGAAIAWLDLERANLIAIAEMATGAGQPTVVIRLSSCLHRYLDYGLHFSQALTLHGEALRAAYACDDRVAESHALIHLGGILESLNDTVRSIEYHREALTLISEISDPIYCGIALINLSYLMQQSDVREAFECARRAAILHQRNGYPSGEARARHRMAGLALAGRRTAEALEYATRAVALARVAEDSAVQSTALRGLGLVYLELADSPRARSCFQESMELCRATGNRKGELFNHLHLGSASLAEKRYVDATDQYRRVLALGSEVDDENGRLEGNFGLGKVLAATGEPDAAAEYFEKALIVAVQLDQAHDEARIRNALAQVLTRLGRQAEASEHRQSAAAILGGLGLPTSGVD